MTARSWNEHGYTAYTHGCRCEVCRTAKADYMRAQRAANRARSQRLTRTSDGQRGNVHNVWVPGSTRYVATGITHGTRHGYEVHQCRCFDCTKARTDADRKYRKRAA